jgi:ABC-type phosphate transport system substrate-binding protein
VDGIPWQSVLAIAGILVPLFAFLWEFVLIGRKRLGYRVQMDTTATDEVTSRQAGAWQRLLARGNGARLNDPSFVLLRIENIGTADIDEDDYSVLHHNKVGIRVRFPDRRVVAMAVTEISEHISPDNFGNESGLGVRNVEDESSRQAHGEIELPKAPLNRGKHYKVMAVLERSSTDGDRRRFADPEVVGGIKGGVLSGGIEQTESRTGTPRWAKALIYALVFVCLAEPLVNARFFTPKAAPLDCASGKVTVVGSTAFTPILTEAAHTYAKICPDTAFSFATSGSQAGLDALDRAGRDGSGNPGGLLAFSDGPKDPGEYPRLVQRPIAYALFTLVANAKAGVDDLPRAEIRDIFVGGKYTNWKRLNGADVPISVVDRNAGSGTRGTLQTHVLGGRVEPSYNSDDCRTRKPRTADRTVRCERDSTDAVLDTVSRVDGAIGYAELGAATARRDVRLVRIDGQEASLAGSEYGAYPFGETEYAYTYRQPRPDSLAASFLRFLTNKIGQDVVRHYGDRPCADLRNPVLCRPEPR